MEIDSESVTEVIASSEAAAAEVDATDPTISEAATTDASAADVAAVTEEVDGENTSEVTEEDQTSTTADAGTDEAVITIEDPPVAIVSNDNSPEAVADEKQPNEAEITIEEPAESNQSEAKSNEALEADLYPPENPAAAEEGKVDAEDEQAEVGVGKIEGEGEGESKVEDAKAVDGNDLEEESEVAADVEKSEEEKEEKEDEKEIEETAEEKTEKITEMEEVDNEKLTPSGDVEMSDNAENDAPTEDAEKMDAEEVKEDQSKANADSIPEGSGADTASKSEAEEIIISSQESSDVIYEEEERPMETESLADAAAAAEATIAAAEATFAAAAAAAEEESKGPESVKETPVKEHVEKEKSVKDAEKETSVKDAEKEASVKDAEETSVKDAEKDVEPPKPQFSVKDNLALISKLSMAKNKVESIRTVALSGFPEDYTLDDVEDFCTSYGTVSKIVSGHYEKDVDDPRFKHRSEGKKDGKEEAASEAAAKEPQQQPAHAFAVEFATHLDAQEFMFHAPTIAGLGIKVEALWSDLTRSRFSLESALDYGCMQRLESFFYRHRADAPRTAKTRKMEPKQIYVHGDYKKVGFQTIIDHMKRFGRVLRMQELTGLYEGLVITFESYSAVKTLTQDVVDHSIMKHKFKTRPFFMTKAIALDPPVNADCVWAQGQTYAVPNFVEMSEDWVVRRKKAHNGETTDEIAMVLDPNLDVDEELDKAITPNTLVNVFPVPEKIPVVQQFEYKNRVWEGKSVYITGAPDDIGWRAFQNYFGLVGLVEYVNVIKPPQHGTIPLDADERPVAIVTFKNSGCVETVMRSEFHYIDDRRLRVRQHTRCPHRVLAVISATPGAEGLPQAWKTSEEIEQVKKYFEMFGKVDFMMYRRTGIKENEPVIIFQMDNFDQIEEILYFTHYIANKALILKQVKRVPEQGPIHLVEDSLQVNESDGAKVKMTCRIDGQRFPPPSPHWWTKEFGLLLAQRRAARDGGTKESQGSSKCGSEEPEVKKRKPNEATAAQPAKPAATKAAAAKSAAASAPAPAPPKPVATSAEKPPVSAAATAPAALTPPPNIPAVRERFVNQARDVTDVVAEEIAYLHIYATKSKDTKTREKFSAVEAKSYFETFGKIKAFWSKKQVMSYAEFAFFDPKVAKKVCLEGNLNIVSLPPAKTQLFFTVFPIYRGEVDHVPWPIGLHKTKNEWLNLKDPEEKKEGAPEYVTIDSDEEPMPPGDIPMPASVKPTPPPGRGTKRSASKDPVSKESTPIPGEPARKRESTPLKVINAFGDNRAQDEAQEFEDEPSNEAPEGDDKKSRAKALLAAALKKRQADGTSAEGGEVGAGTGGGANKAKRTVYVRGFMDDPSQSVKLDVFKYFKQFGKVENVNLGYSKEQGLQYTWASVEMEDDLVIKDLIRSNLFMDGFPLHLSRKKDSWDSDAGGSRLESEHWKHAYVTGLSDKVTADEIQGFLDAKVGGIKRVDCRVVNNLSIFLVELDSNASCMKALKGGSFSFLGEIFLWPPYVYEDLCVRKNTFEQQLTTLQSLCEIPPKKMIYHCLIVQKLETQLRSFFPDCTLRIAGDALTRMLPSDTLDLYFEFTPEDNVAYRDPKAPKVSLDDVKEGDVPVSQLSILPGHSRLQLLSAALEEIGVAGTFRVQAPTTKRKASLSFRHGASNLSCSIGVSKTTEMQRTTLLQLLQQHDARFAPLYFAFRQFLHVWSRIDSRVASLAPLDKTPSDVVILIMTMVYLQQVQPPILPAIRDLQALSEEPSMVEGWNCVSGSLSAADIPRTEMNTSSLLSLLQGIFQFYAHYDFDNFVLSPYYGRSIPFSLLFVPQVPGQDDLFKIGNKMNVQDIFQLNRNLTVDVKAVLRESIAGGCTKGFAALSSPDIEDATLLDQVVWGYPLILNEHVLKNAQPIVDAFHPLDQHLPPLVDLDVSGLESAPKKDLNVTEYIYMIKEDLPETLLPVIKQSSNLVWFQHICFLVHRALAYSLHIHCKVVESRYPLRTDEAVKVAFNADAISKGNKGGEAIEKVAEFWCFTPIKLRKNYATYWTSSGKNMPASPSTGTELIVLQNLYREVHRKGHACYQPVCFSVVLEQMNTAQPAVKITLTGEHIHKPLLDFLKDYLPKIVNTQFGEIFE